MSKIVTLELNNDIATITMEDGKANAMSFELAAQLNAVLDEVEKTAKAVVLKGGARCFCAGFDLEVMKAGGPERDRLMAEGFSLAYRLLNFPCPVIAATDGHALAMGAILLLAVDYRIAQDNKAKIGLNEIAIGVEMPSFGVDLVLDRLAKPAQIPALANAVIYSPAQAVGAGFVDEVQGADSWASRIDEVAGYLATLDKSAHQKAKRALRSAFLAKYKSEFGG